MLAQRADDISALFAAMRAGNQPGRKKSARGKKSDIIVRGIVNIVMRVDKSLSHSAVETRVALLSEAQFKAAADLLLKIGGYIEKPRAMFDLVMADPQQLPEAAD